MKKTLKLLPIIYLSFCHNHQTKGMNIQRAEDIDQKRNQHIILAHNQLCEQQAETRAQLTILLNTAIKGIEQLLAIDQQQRRNFSNAINQANNDYEKYIESISESHALPLTNDTLPTIPESGHNLAILIKTLAAVNKCNTIAGDYLESVPSNELYNENKK